MTTMQDALVDVTPELLEQWLADGTAVLIDVREDYEYDAERIDGAHNIPLSRFDPSEVRAACGDRRAVFQCRSGKRSVTAAMQYGNEQRFHLAGGIMAWKASGRPTGIPSSAPKLDVMRQVQITAGALVFAGVMLGAFVSEWFLILAGFVGAGLMFAGISGWCGMAKLLARMPWN